jgi:hypothetical protein
MPMFALVRKLLTFHWLATLVLMGVFGLIFGLSSYNLFHLLAANLSFIASHGAMALMEGALEQLFWLIFYGYLAVIAYVLLKACEHALMDRIFDDTGRASSHAPPADTPAEPAPASLSR